MYLSLLLEFTVHLTMLGLVIGSFIDAMSVWASTKNSLTAISRAHRLLISLRGDVVSSCLVPSAI